MSGRKPTGEAHGRAGRPETFAMLETMKILAAILLSGVLLLYFFQGALIFFPPNVPAQSREAFAGYAWEVEHEGTRLKGWYVPGAVSRNHPLLVYYGGNAEEVSGNLWELSRLQAGAYLFMNYRGYGDSGGRPSQKALCRDALYVLDTLSARDHIPLDQIVLMGRSLGSGVAVYVAAHRAVRGVILITPFDSLLKVARHHYPFLPVGLILRHPFDSAALAPEIELPALILMGDRDDIVPNSRSMELARRWGGPVVSVVIEGVGHNDIQSDPRYWRAINGFLSETTQPPGDPRSAVSGAAP
jgi:pimeloyl-ACP methyl ester carboxylesterase